MYARHPANASGDYGYNYAVRHNGFGSSQPPQPYGKTWHVRDYGGGVEFKEQQCSCPSWPKCEHQSVRYAPYGYATNAARAADDEDGFQQRPAPYRGVVVNAAGTSSVVRPQAETTEQPAEEPSSCCGWCTRSRSATATQEATCLFSWCRPTVLLVILVVLVVVFVSVSGILLYYNYLTHKPRQHLIEEPCEKTFCSWGAHCITGSDGRALCQCPVHCVDTADPVCGTDNITYKNGCLLRVASCKARLNTRVLHEGKCEEADPCRDKLCSFGARCVASPDGRTASCQCPDRCPNFGDHSQSRSVCGSDGVDYNNLCELERAACKSSTNITRKFAGKCDPCAGVECAEPEICQLDDDRNPVCRCGDTCPLEFTPVCGSDGKTYSNECSLRQEACRARKSLNIIYRGKCSSGVNPCLSVQCTQGEECAIDKYGIARCQCPPECEPIMRPVCSKDGHTYPSECELKRAACLQRAEISIAYTGFCGEMGPCSVHKCQFGAVCVELAGTAHCECPKCPAEFEPVCGSDGITYGNECKLKLEACKYRREIRVLYGGPCNGCENKHCDHYAVCESDGTTEGKCVCPETCPKEKLAGAVCGTDGETYPTECDLQKASCKKQQLVVVSYAGDCDMCRGITCEFGAKCEAGECVCPMDCKGAGEEPICASNMVTYRNECELQKANCALPTPSGKLKVVFFGDCKERFPVAVTTPVPTVVTSDVTNASTEVVSNTIEKEACKDIHCFYEATCELGPDNFPRCTCQFDCSSQGGKPVCASDLRLYPSVCAMKMEACQRQEELRLRPLDLCQGMEVKPCNGEKPLPDPLTGKELDCGNGPHRQDCPSGSYCHQTARFSRCCRKDQSALQHKSCEDSWYGCCPDGKTPAQGPDHAGCPSLCGCNKLGSYSDVCDPETQQCKCRPGVGGVKCDRCEPGYWGLPKISSGHRGCIPCGCSAFGSVRDDCEQMTGRCVCKPDIQGQKCTVCSSHNKILGPNGCVSPDAINTPLTSCKQLTCHFGATCVEREGIALCECHTECTPHEKEEQIVCGSDGHTYNSPCELQKVACRMQKDIVVQSFGTCKEYMFPGTDWPIRRYTPLQYTQPDDSNSPLSKSTRHLLVPDPRYYYERGGSLIRPPYTEPEAIGTPAESNIEKSDSIYNTRGGSYAAAYRPTPATVRVVTALLGDICSDNTDCLIMHSNCVGGACTCISGYVESRDRQECVASGEDYGACSSSPCKSGSTCLDLPSGTFTCVCAANLTGTFCDIEISYKHFETPAFDGRSYVRLKPMKAYHKLSLEVEFKTNTEDGVILYNQQKANGLGDFVSLAIINGYVEFRYNLGNGAAVITSLEKVELRKFHKVVVKRYHRDGMLKLDDGEEIGGESPGNLKALDLVEDTFIGFVPSNYSRVHENIGTNKGFAGCIKRLKINRRSVNFHEIKDNLIIKMEGVRECGSSPCSSIPCRNGGICEPLDTESFTCECPREYTGEFCETPLDPCMSNPCAQGSYCDATGQGEYVCKCPPGRKGNNCDLLDTVSISSTPLFTGASFIQFPKLEGVGRSFSIEVSFLTKTLNGLILYNGQMKNGRGDFISLNLVQGHLQFRYNLGSGIANISSEKVSLNEWHWVRIYRNGREGLLQLDNSTLIRGSSGPPLTELNVELPFYIGSLLSWQEIHKLSGASKGFNGAIQRVLLNGQPLPISANMPLCSFVPLNVTGCGFKIEPYDGLPCPISKNPCLNKGSCMPNLGEYSCRCDAGYTGKHCEVSTSDGGSIKFNGATFLQYKNRGYRSNITDDEYIDDEEYVDGDEENYYDDDGRKGERGNRYEFRLKTLAPNGLLLWRSKSKSFKEDYFSLAVVDGYPEVSYSLGKQQAFWTIRSQSRIDDGEWHTLNVRRRKRVGFISVDDETPIRGVFSGGAITLRTTGKLWVGGSPSLPIGLPAAYYKGFEGCIRHININAKPLNMLMHSDQNVLKYCHDNEI